jgi:hypothetical protein
MKRMVLLLASASIAAAGLAGMATSQTINSTLVTPSEIPWGPATAVLPPDAQETVLYGDPTKIGLFSMQFKLPTGYSGNASKPEGYPSPLGHRRCVVNPGLPQRLIH